MESVIKNAELNIQKVEAPSLTAIVDLRPPLTLDQLATQAKEAQILEACKWKNIETLQNLAVSHSGLLSDEIRRQVWPILLGCRDDDEDIKFKKEDGPSWNSLPRHSDEDQVQLDVDRSFVYYPNDQSSKELDVRKKELSDLITEVLRRNPFLCYFQGYHDICQVFLLVLSPHQRTQSVSRLSALRIRDFMLPTLSPALSQLRLIPAIISTVNPELYAHLSLTQPFFALSGTLTMYAHDIQEYGSIARLFDALIAREAVFSVYMFAQIVLQRADELFDTPADEPEMLHSILSKLPKHLDLEALIENTAVLVDTIPPERLSGWRSISRHSVLKTARWQDQATKQTLEEGRTYFEKQVKELEWARRRDKMRAVAWKYRRPASVAGLAILVGVLSFYMRKSNVSNWVLSAIWRFVKFGAP